MIIFVANSNFDICCKISRLVVAQYGRVPHWQAAEAQFWSTLCCNSQYHSNHAFSLQQLLVDIAKNHPSYKCCRGLYFTLFRAKPLENKTPIFSWFYKKLGPFYKKNSILTLFTDPKAKRSENAPNNQIQSHIKDLCCNSFIVPQLLKWLL